MSSDSRVPTRTARTDLSGLRLEPADGFVLSRVDGILAVDGIAAQTGLGSDMVVQSLTRLARAGLVSLDGVEAASATEAVPDALKATSP